MAGLLKYFRREVLPDPKGSLSEKVPIELTNNTSCHNILDKKTTPCGKCGESTYIHSIYMVATTRRINLYTWYSHAPWPARKCMHVVHQLY